MEESCFFKMHGGVEDDGALTTPACLMFEVLVSLEFRYQLIRSSWGAAGGELQFKDTKVRDSET